VRGLSSAGSPSKAVPRLGGCDGQDLEAVPVSTRVNSPRNDDASIIQPEDEPLGAQHALL
jgi:hypothetical protein